MTKCGGVHRLAIPTPFAVGRVNVYLIDGVNTGLTWATTELHAIRSPNGTDVLVLRGERGTR